MAPGIPFTYPVDCGSSGTCELKMDIYRPVPDGASPPLPADGSPLILALPGGPQPPNARGTLSNIATALTVQGAVVMLADYRAGPQFGGGYPTTFEDVSCAVRYARSIAATYGADPSRVTLLAHSFGGFPAAVVTLSPKTVAPLNGRCLATEGSPRPDAYVGLAPISTLDDITQDFLVPFMGGTAAEQPGQWAAADPLALAAATNRYETPVTLIVGTSDVTVPPVRVTPLIDALREAGRDAAEVSIAGADHQSILVDPITISTILSAASG